jgi:hypothetical protein
MPPNFVLLDSTQLDIERLVVAMVQARDAVGRRSWSHPQEPTSNEWWADVLADRALASENGAPISQSSKHSIGSPTKSAGSYLWHAASATGAPRLRATN